MEERTSLIKIKPKNYSDGEIVKVDFMVMHPMETGMRKDKKTGEIVPAQYINNVKFNYNGKLISSMKVWESVSVNPVFTIAMKVAGQGKLTVTFTDSTGESSENSIMIQPKG